MLAPSQPRSTPALREVLFCGGSALAPVGVSRAEAFPFLVARHLRSAHREVTIRILPNNGDPRTVLANRKLAGRRDYLLVVVPRNMSGVPLLPVVRRALVRRLTGRPAPDEELPPPSALSAQTGGSRSLRRLAALLLSVACLPALPFLTRTHGRRLDAALDALWPAGCQGVVLATPIRLPWRHYPGAPWYQAALARSIRRRASGRVAIADVYRRLEELTDAARMLPHDPFHLTAAGHQLVADEVSMAIHRLRMTD